MPDPCDPTSGYPSFSSMKSTLSMAPGAMGKSLWYTDHTFMQSYHMVLPELMTFYSKNGLWNQMKPDEGRCLPLWQLRWNFLCYFTSQAMLSSVIYASPHTPPLPVSISISTNPCTLMHPNCQLLSWYHLASDLKCCPLNTVTLESHQLTDIRKPRFIATFPMVIPILQRVVITRLLKGASISITVSPLLL